ncbi:MAG: hypothetical protein RIA63_14035 [Cyclobacteriaceae bacterium]
MKRGSWILKIALAVLLGVSLFGLVTQLLWNWLVPMLFAGPVITFWQALGLLLLTKILFWPFGKRHHGGHKGGYWRPYWKEKWNKMTDEEKQQFREKMREKCGWGRSVGEEKNPVQ